MTSGSVARRLGAQAGLGVSKVPPQITAWFWLAKVVSTGQGEATSDFLYFHYGKLVTGTIGVILLVGALAWQLSVRRYLTWVYWFAVAAVSVTGTMAADGLHLVVGLPYWQTTTMFAVALAVIFAAWYLTERTLSIHSITTFRREVFYWLTVIATFGLGTALGDLVATPLKQGYFRAAVIFLVLICIPLLAHWRLGMNPVLAFWFAYTLTRPLGASIADWLGVSHSLGGLGWGRGVVAIVLLVPLVAIVAYMAVSRVDTPAGEPVPVPVRARHRAG